MMSSCRSPVRALAAVVFVASSAASFGCSSDDTRPNEPAAADGSTTTIGCSADPRVQTFVPGMQAKSNSGRFVAEIASATPSPPQRGAGEAGINTWSLKLTLDGAVPTAPISVKTLMPDHGHGSPRAATVTARQDGTFAVENLFLFMAGVWEITFAAASGETAMFSLCVE